MPKYGRHIEHVKVLFPDRGWRKWSCSFPVCDELFDVDSAVVSSKRLLLVRRIAKHRYHQVLLEYITIH